MRAREQLIDARVELLGRIDVEPALQQRRVPDQPRECLRRGRLLVRLKLRSRRMQGSQGRFTGGLTINSQCTVGTVSSKRALTGQKGAAAALQSREG